MFVMSKFDPVEERGGGGESGCCPGGVKPVVTNREQLYALNEMIQEKGGCPERKWRKEKSPQRVSNNCKDLF